MGKYSIRLFKPLEMHNEIVYMLVCIHWLVIKFRNSYTTKASDFHKRLINILCLGSINYFYDIKCQLYVFNSQICIPNLTLSPSPKLGNHSQFFYVSYKNIGHILKIASKHLLHTYCHLPWTIFCCTLCITVWLFP